VKRLAPAKVNFHLQILGKRADGYHEIQTIMARVGIFDELEISFGGKGLELFLEGEKTPPGEENLVLRAARLFLQSVGIKEGIRFRLHKRIPVGAGLGGGSSDAACVLEGLNELLQRHFSPRELIALGRQIGADVPFFIFKKPAVARGIGEELKEIILPESLWIFLLIPPFSISTAWAYGAYDRLQASPQMPTEIPGSFQDLASLGSIMRNDLEPSVIPNYPEIGEMKRRLLSHGAQGALMSGSGSAVFGIFSSRARAERTAREIELPVGWKGMILPILHE
jgi:4-diphosphocytidyl-2-C-methyl-D-erythritol kinase